MRRHSTIVAGTIAGIAILGAAGPALTGTALAGSGPGGSGTDSVVGLAVTLTPVKGAPGDSVQVAAVAHQAMANAVATSPVLGTFTLQVSGQSAEGTGKILTTAKPGVYPVTVTAHGVEGVRLSGGARLIVVVTTPTPTPTPTQSTTPTPTPSTSVTPTPSPTGTTPSGGIGTGGGGAAGADLGLVTAGSAIALLGIATAVMAMRRRQDDVHH